MRAPRREDGLALSHSYVSEGLKVPPGALRSSLKHIAYGQSPIIFSFLFTLFYCTLQSIARSITANSGTSRVECFKPSPVCLEFEQSPRPTQCAYSAVSLAGLCSANAPAMNLCRSFGHAQRPFNSTLVAFSIHLGAIC
ncbi:hypothetical protein KQX54_004470 [Cotesia glomerata]|uniref:Uncharacterized protein n=1 Tax=Cotesia glomerata TaxID=32391 RepID=A0AAV7J230_COTGL|nr:hypothetical protein KQX54_004470 [Cotesia glomerata]